MAPGNLGAAAATSTGSLRWIAQACWKSGPKTKALSGHGPATVWRTGTFAMNVTIGSGLVIVASRDAGAVLDWRCGLGPVSLSGTSLQLGVFYFI